MIQEKLSAVPRKFKRIREKGQLNRSKVEIGKINNLKSAGELESCSKRSLDTKENIGTLDEKQKKISSIKPNSSLGEKVLSGDKLRLFSKGRKDSLGSMSGRRDSLGSNCTRRDSLGSNSVGMESGRFPRRASIFSMNAMMVDPINAGYKNPLLNEHQRRSLDLVSSLIADVEKRKMQMERCRFSIDNSLVKPQTAIHCASYQSRRPSIFFGIQTEMYCLQSQLKCSLNLILKKCYNLNKTMNYIP